MSSLYQTPSEVSKNIADRTKTGNWFQDTFTDYISGGLSVGADGRVKREGAAWWLQGLTPGAEAIARANEGLAEATAIDSVVSRSGLTTDELRKAAGGQKLTSSNINNIVNKATRIVQDTPSTIERHTMNRQLKADERAAQAQEDANEIAKETLQSNERSKQTDRLMQADKFNFTTKIEGMRQGHTASETAKDRALTRDLNNSSNDLAMQMKFMDAELADKRMEYDRETRRMDKRDRMIAQLMAGIGQLGGAFAL